MGDARDPAIASATATAAPAPATAISHVHVPSSLSPPAALSPETIETVDDMASGGIAGVSRVMARVAVSVVQSIGKATIAGTTSGLLEEVAVYPLELAKARMQISTGHVTMTAIVRDIIKRDGVRGLFAGLAAPVIGSSVQNAILFGSYERSVSLLAGKHHNADWKHWFAAGAIAGAAASIVTCPVELVARRMQVLTHNQPSITIPTTIVSAAATERPLVVTAAAATPIITTGQMARNIWNNGGIRALYRGMVPTLLRDIPAYSAFFGTYEVLKRQLDSSIAAASHDTSGGGHGGSLTSVVLAGGIAGSAQRLITYPIDVVKSHMQISDISGQTFRSTWMQIYRTGGVTAFSKGLGPSMAHGFPAAAIGFAAYEAALQLLRVVPDH